MGDTVDKYDWARAISRRIADEWDGDNEEDRELLQRVLSQAFVRCPDLAQELVGTTIIEEDFFENYILLRGG